jgi:hypothetical protein
MFLNTLKRGHLSSAIGDIRFKSKYSKPFWKVSPQAARVSPDNLIPKISNSCILQYKKNIIPNSKNIFEKIKSINRKDTRHSSHQFKNLHLMMNYHSQDELARGDHSQDELARGDHSQDELARGDHSQDFYTIQNPFQDCKESKNKQNHQLKNLSQSISPEFIVNCCERDCVKCVFSSSYDKNADKLSCCGMDCEYCEFSTRG